MQEPGSFMDALKYSISFPESSTISRACSVVRVGAGVMVGGAVVAVIVGVTLAASMTIRGSEVAVSDGGMVA
jgi:hypothetical protein